MSIPFKQYIPGYEEQANLKADMKVMVERICVTQLSHFNDLNEHIVWNFEHQHSKELSTKSTVVSSLHVRFSVGQICHLCISNTLQVHSTFRYH